MAAPFSEDPLWLGLKAMEFDEPGRSLTFARRLKAETGWTPEDTADAVGEYLGFVYLTCQDRRPFSPLPRVNETRKRHATFTRHYRDHPCGAVLGRNLGYRSATETNKDLSEPDPPGPAMFLAVAHYLIVRSWDTGAFAPGLPPGRSAPHSTGYEADGLWQSLDNVALGSLDANRFPFASQFAQETGRSKNRCLGTIVEYRKFLYLAARASHKVTPSEAVDELWHLLLAHGLHYWTELCENMLCRPLHHGPATGKEGENARLLGQYRQKLASGVSSKFSRPPRFGELRSGKQTAAISIPAAWYFPLC